MNELFVELIKQVPNAVAVIVMAYLFLKAEKEREERREANAKEIEQSRREHNIFINNMWAISIKQVVESQNAASETIAQTLAEHEKASQERYERMKVTDQLIKAVQELTMAREVKP